MFDDFVFLVNGFLLSQTKASLSALAGVCAVIMIFSFAACVRFAGKPGAGENDND